MSYYKWKGWTILLYSNANNELSQEMLESIHALKESKLKNLYMVIQVSYTKRFLEAISPSRISFLHRWEGMYRYLVSEDSKLLLIHEGPVVNMAHPHTLYTFILWGLRTFPAHKYILILSGHGAGILGVLADYSPKRPYLMPMPALVQVLKGAAEDLKRLPALLILDLCYMNTMELLYEWMAIKDFQEELLLIPREGALGGLPYLQIVEYIDKHASCRELETLFLGMCKEIEGEPSLPLLLKLRDSTLKRIRQMYYQLTEGEGVRDLLALTNKEKRKLTQEIEREGQKMILSPRERDNFTLYSPKSLKEFEKYENEYQKLAFSMSRRESRIDPLVEIPKTIMIHTLRSLNSQLTLEETLKIIDRIWYR